MKFEIKFKSTLTETIIICCMKHNYKPNEMFKLLIFSRTCVQIMSFQFTKQYKQYVRRNYPT